VNADGAWPWLPPLAVVIRSTSTISATVATPTISWVRVVTLIRTTDSTTKNAIPRKKNKIHQSGFMPSRFAAR